MLRWRADGRLAAQVDDERQYRAMGGPVRLAVIGYVPVSTVTVPWGMGGGRRSRGGMHAENIKETAGILAVHA